MSVPSEVSEELRREARGGPTIGMDLLKSPSDDLKEAGESLSFEDADEALACITAILDYHLLNGATHCHMVRWKLKALRALTAAYERGGAQGREEETR